MVHWMHVDVNYSILSCYIQIENDISLVRWSVSTSWVPTLKTSLQTLFLLTLLSCSAWVFKCVAKYIHTSLTGPLKLCKWNHHALVKFHIRWYIWVCGDQKIWKLKISDGVILIFPIFWKKNWKKSRKKISKKNFFLLKFVFLS